MVSVEILGTLSSVIVAVSLTQKNIKLSKDPEPDRSRGICCIRILHRINTCAGTEQLHSCHRPLLLLDNDKVQVIF